MSKKLIYGLIAGAALTLGFSSCNNEDFLDVTHYTMLTGNAMFENDDNAIKGMTGCYDLLHRREGKNDDPYKYWIFNGLHPTMDSQASGWDKDFMVQKWTAKNEQLRDYWKQSYACASRCNDFLAGLEENKENISDDVYRHLKGEAMALRGFQFFALANTFGRVPLLITGENYINTPEKAKAETFGEMWDFVIADFEAAAELLDWDPFQGQYGRCTKGMALAFLGDAYMWKAYACSHAEVYMCPKEEVNTQECYQKAYNALKQIIDNPTHELAASYSTLYDADEAWPKEAIWQIVLNSGDYWGSWDDSDNAGARGWTGFYFGPTSNGAWGTYQMSWELYDTFENYTEGQYAGSFDKRRDASMVTATVPVENIPADKRAKWAQRVKPTQKWLDTNKGLLRGYKDGAFDQATYDAYKWEDEAGNGTYDPTYGIGFNPFNQEFVGWCGYHWASSDPAPTVWSSKHWRNGRGCDWSTGALWLPDHIYFKRYANVLLDCAECCFILGGKDAEGWGYIDQIRNRAFGNDEVGKDLSKFCTHHQKVADFYGDQGHGDAVDLDGYPIPFNTETVKFPSAQEYYTKVKAEKGYSSPEWKVALGEERRKEFSAEPYLRSDLHKSDFLEDHISTVYPLTPNLDEYGLSVIKEWRTCRKFNFDMKKMFMPIPEDEILKNPACTQNPGY